MGKITIDQIEGIIIQQASSTYKLIKRKNDWAFLNIESNVENGNYTKDSAYKMVLDKSTKIISIPKKFNKYELWEK